MRIDTSNVLAGHEFDTLVQGPTGITLGTGDGQLQNVTAFTVDGSEINIVVAGVVVAMGFSITEIFAPSGLYRFTLPTAAVPAESDVFPPGVVSHGRMGCFAWSLAGGGGGGGLVTYFIQNADIPAMIADTDIQATAAVAQSTIAATQSTAAALLAKVAARAATNMKLNPDGSYVVYDTDGSVLCTGVMKNSAGAQTNNAATIVQTVWGSGS